MNSHQELEDTIEKNNLENFLTENEISSHKKSSHLRIGTYNILTSFSYKPKEGEKSENDKLSWHFRKDLIVEFIKKMDVDILGLQEVSIEQMDYLKTKLPDFGMIGFAAYTGHSLNEIDSEEYVGEIVPILYNKSKIECITSQVFWLSTTPDKISKGWDASRPRIIAAGVFLDKTTGTKLVVGNTHYDHLGNQALVNSGDVEVKQLEKFKEQHNASDVLFLGDRNCFTDNGRHGNEWYKNFLKESHATDIRTCGKHIGAGTTFFGYHPDEYKAPYDVSKNSFKPNTLDLIFHKGSKYGVKKSKCSPGEYEFDEKGNAHLLPFFNKIKNPEKRQFASDHAFVITDLKFK